MNTTKSKIKIKKSDLDGANKGVFAKSLFHKGDVICEYAGDIKSKTYMADLYESNYNEYLKLHKYARDLNSNTVVIGDHKLAEEDWIKSGVYVNDGACLDTSINYDSCLEQHIELISRYVCNSKMKQNVEPIVRDGKIYYIAIKRIKKEEELYTHYGKHYWLLLSGIGAEKLKEF